MSNYEKSRCLKTVDKLEEKIDLSPFSKCKTVIVNGNHDDIIYPENMEHLFIDNTWNSQTLDLRSFSKLKRLFCYFEYLEYFSENNELHLLLPSHLELVELSGDEIIIDNLDEIEIDAFYIDNELQ